ESKGYSNALSFKVQDCREELGKGKTLKEVCGSDKATCCPGGSCVEEGESCEAAYKSSMFAWSFSTGKLPIVPRVVERCGNFCAGTNTRCGDKADCQNQTGDAAKNCLPVTPSPSPALLWSGSDSVCVNAVGEVLFSTKVDNNGVPLANDNAQNLVFIYQCPLSGDCVLSEENQIVPVSYDIYNDDLAGNGLEFKPNQDFATGTVYKVIVTTKVRSTASGLEANMLADPACPNISKVFLDRQAAYCFGFKTDTSPNYCKIGNVTINPLTYTTSTLNTTAENFYDATPLAAGNFCLALNGDSYDWRWNPTDESKSNASTSEYCSVSNKDEKPQDSRTDTKNQDLTIKEKETPQTQLITATWLDDADHLDFDKKIHGTAYLDILPTRPEVVNYWPNCNAACLNAEIGFKFNILVKGIFQAAILYKCGDASCAKGLDGSEVAVNFEFVDSNGKEVDKFAAAREAVLKPQTGSLAQNTYYRVFIKAGNQGVKSENDIPLVVPLKIEEKANPHYFLTEKNIVGFSWVFRTKNTLEICEIDKVKIEPAAATVNIVGAKAYFIGEAWGGADECSPNGQRLAATAYNWNWSSADIKVATVTNFDKGARPAGSNPITAYCGNSKVDEFINEECEPPDLENKTCDLTCRKLPRPAGTLPCASPKDKNCCGNGGTFSAPEEGEECDLGQLNGQPGSSCSKNCLAVGAPISFNECFNLNTNFEYGEKRRKDCLLTWHALSVCGNGGAPEPGEECDAGSQNGVKDANGDIQSGCTVKCLLTAKSFGKDSGECGNNIIEPANNEQCDGEIGCGKDCRLSGPGDELIDPWQFATAVGKGEVKDKKQTTKINAEAAPPKNNIKKSGSADFILQCGFQPVDALCPDNSPDPQNGVGKDSCCYPRPLVKSFEPSIAANICPNALLKIKFDQAMDEASFTSSTQGFYNIVLAEAGEKGTETKCGEGQYKVAVETTPHNFWDKIKQWARQLLGRPVEAVIYCEGAVDYTLQFEDVATADGSGIFSTSTIVSVVPQQALSLQRGYKLI
ncbi:MAG: hypothetical protein HY982_01500, partial [Candidatus Magasanikbacteria bacterium]|nr:hypothetical protein [Candidatus Magasanikbacteria bacterium]